MDREEHLIIGVMALKTLYKTIGFTDGHGMQEIHNRFRKWALAHNYSHNDLSLINNIMAMLTMDGVSDESCLNLEAEIKERIGRLNNGQ